MTTRIVLLWLVFIWISLSQQHIQVPYNEILDTCCKNGDLYTCLQICSNENDKNAETFLIRSNLELILNANMTAAVMLRKFGKALNSSALPPLALLHLNGNDCGGLGDLFYVSAIMIQNYASFDDPNLAPKKQIIESSSQLITLLADSGLHNATEIHLQHTISHFPNEIPFLFRAALATPAVFESLSHLDDTRRILEGRVKSLLATDRNFNLRQLDEFVLSPTFYFVYQGYNDKEILRNLHLAYSRAHPRLHKQHIKPPMKIIDSSKITSSLQRKINVGFVSRHFRRHSICKLFCGVMAGLNTTIFNVYAFSSLSESSEDLITAQVRSSLSFVSVGNTFFSTRQEVLDRQVDVLVYLDVGMDPSTVAWAAARLAPVQVCTWGHPTTTGLQSMDYYISSHLYHEIEYSYTQDRFIEQLVMFDSLGFYFERPSLTGRKSFDENYLNDIVNRPASFYMQIKSELRIKNSNGSQYLLSLLEEKTNITTGRVQGIILCPQHLPKFHPSFDEVLLGALVRYPDSVVVTIGLEKKYQWRRTLTQRWKNYLAEVYRLAHSSSGSSMGDADEVLFIDNVIARIRWLPSLSPSEYLILLSVGDVMVDPFPFGGGVTTLESLAVCTPVVTYPGRQTVPELAAGMLRKLALPSSVSATLIVNSVEEYVESIGLLLAERRLQETGNMREEEEEEEESGNSTDITSVYIRRELCNRVSHLYEQQDVSKEWGNFIVNAFNSAI